MTLQVYEAGMKISTLPKLRFFIFQETLISVITTATEWSSTKTEIKVLLR